MQHPIHLHGQRMLVIARDGVPTRNRVWKDTALIPVGSTVDLLIDASNPGAPVYLASGNNTSGSLTANGNGTGQIAWGDITNNADGSVSRTLYAMSTNQGIQAFVVTVPEPATLSMIGLLFAACGLVSRRRMG